MAEDIEKGNEGKQSWSHIHNSLENYGLGTNVTESFNDMLIQFDMIMDQYISNGVHSSKSHPKSFPNETFVKLEYTTICITVCTYGVIKYILSFVTKGQKGMSIMIEHVCEDGKNGNMDLKRICPSILVMYF